MVKIDADIVVEHGGKRATNGPSDQEQTQHATALLGPLPALGVALPGRRPG